MYTQYKVSNVMNLVKERLTIETPEVKLLGFDLIKS